MSETFDLKSLKVGDEVAYGYYSWEWQYTIVKVVKITPKGQIALDNNKRFGPDGVIIGGYIGDRGKCCLTSADEARTILANRKIISDNRIKVDTLLELFRQNRNGNGNYFFKPEVWTALDKLIEEMKKPQSE